MINEHTRGEEGFSLLQMLIVVAIIAILSSIAVMGISNARDGIRLGNSTRELTSYLERARADSARRLTQTSPAAEQARIAITANDRYTITIDFNTDGVISANETRTVTLRDGITISQINGATPTYPMTINFTARGRTANNANSTITMQNARGETASLVVTAAGDVTDRSTVIAPASNTNLSVNGNINSNQSIRPL